MGDDGLNDDLMGVDLSPPSPAALPPGDNETTTRTNLCPSPPQFHLCSLPGGMGEDSTVVVSQDRSHVSLHLLAPSRPSMPPLITPKRSDGKPAE